MIRYVTMTQKLNGCTYVITQWAAVMTNRSAISAPPQKNTPSRAMATCQVCSPMSASSLPMILRLSPSTSSSPANRNRTGSERLRHDRVTADRRKIRCRLLFAFPAPSPRQRPNSNDGVRRADGSLELWSSFIFRTEDVIPQSGDSEIEGRHRHFLIWYHCQHRGGGGLRLGKVNYNLRKLFM